MADRIASAARANTERTAPHLLTPAPVPTAELLARLNAVRVEVPLNHPDFGDDVVLAQDGRGLFWRTSGDSWECADIEARNAVTVAALEVVRKAAESSDEDGQHAYMLWCQLCKIPGAPYTPDLAAAAVEAAIRVREVTNG